MGAVWYRARSELRRRWLSTLVVVVLVGVGAGAVLVAAAGARRTASAYPRFVAASDASDVLVNPNDGDTDFDAIAALPQVEDLALVDGLLAPLRNSDGSPNLDVDMINLASQGGFGYERDRPVRLEGRLPARDALDEVALGDVLADDLDAEVGDTLPLVRFGSEEEPPEPIDVTVTGIGRFPFEVLEDEGSRSTFPMMFHGPAAARAWADPEQAFRVGVVHLRGGEEDRREFVDAAQRVAGEQLFLQTQAETTASAQRTLQPYAGALGLFAAVAGVAGLLVVGQAVVRHLLADAGDTGALAALGLGRHQVVVGTVLRAGSVGGVGAGLALVLGAIGSTWMPVGPARTVEPAPGVQLDWLVLGGGALAVVAITLGTGAVVGVLVARRNRAAPAAGGRLRLAAALAASGAPPAWAAGVRMATDGGRGASSIPVRTTLVGAVTGLTALVAALTFGAGLDRLLDTPRLYGWSWDAYVQREPIEPAALARLERLDSVEAFSVGNYGQVAVDGVQVPVIGLGEDGAPDVGPPILEGRAAGSPEEVVLGTSTLRRLDRDVGDRVELSVGGETVSAVVVGRAVFPKLAAYPGQDKVGLGNGLAATVPGLQRLLPEAAPGFLLVRFAPGADRDAARADLQELFPDPEDAEEPTVELRPQQPDDLLGYDRMGVMPLVLAGLLGLLAVGATAHALVTSVRRRRRELATFKTLGFTRRQVSVAVAWQATTVAVVALVLGLPLGVAAGRVLWGVLADRLGAIAQPVTPAIAVLVTIPAVLVVANLVAALPGRRAGRIVPAVALRSE